MKKRFSIKEYLYNFLGLDALNSRITLLNSRVEELNRRIHVFEKLTKVGVDYHAYTKESWAVVCLAGKIEYVNFMNLSGCDAEEIKRIFKHFQGKNKIHDTPHFYDLG